MLSTLAPSIGSVPSLRRTWREHPYGEGEITFLEEEVLPAIRECLVLRKNAKDLTFQLLYEKIGWKYMLAR
jgi:hypothetical protein